MKIREIFEKGNVVLGWAALWRLALILLPLNFLARLAAVEASTNPAGAVAMLFALPVGGNVYLVPVAIPIVLFAWNWVGKYVMEKKLGVRPARFVGWSLYWRALLLQLAGVFALTVVFLPLTFLARNVGDRTQMVLLALVGLVLAPAFVYWTLNVCGFVVRRVAAMVPISQTVQTESPEGGPVLVRSYQALFDPSRYGMNWTLAAVYPVTGLIGLYTWPLVEALFGGELYFPPAGLLPIFFLSWILGGLGLTFFLHYMREGWQVVLAFVILLLATRMLQNSLMGFVQDQPAMPLWDPQSLIARAVFAALFAGGLLAGIRLIGPTILGFGIAVSAAVLIQSAIAFPLLSFVFHGGSIDGLWSLSRLGMDFVSALIDVVLYGVAFWWACNWHLGRRGLRLTQRGVIEASA